MKDVDRIMLMWRVVFIEIPQIERVHCVSGQIVPVPVSCLQRLKSVAFDNLTISPLDQLIRKRETALFGPFIQLIPIHACVFHSMVWHGICPRRYPVVCVEGQVRDTHQVFT